MKYKIPRKLKKQIPVGLYCYKSYKTILNKLQSYIDNKLIPVSVRLSTNYVYLIFDDEILNGYSLNISDRTKEVKQIKDTHIDKETKTVLIKDVYKKYYKLQEEKKLFGKLNYRYLAIDTNPDYIGCSVIDKIDNKIDIVYTFNYDLTILNEKVDKSCNIDCKKRINNKRKHGISHIWKDVFAIAKYYKCGYIVLEELTIKDNDLGSKQANRKVNNLWYRELSTNLINKYCNRNGLIKIEVNPCYSSFIGNLQHNYVDPVNASIEIGRRGMFKYNKGMFYPVMNIGTIMNTMSRINSVDLRDVSYLKDCESWVELYRKVRESGLRYRATLDDVKTEYKVVNNIIHSKISKMCFSLEKSILLPNIL